MEVAQIGNLLYRRLVIGNLLNLPAVQGDGWFAECHSAIRQITNLRYSFDIASMQSDLLLPLAARQALAPE